MPNWCSNSVTIEGSAENMRKLFDVIDAMKDDDGLFVSTVGKKKSYGDDWYNHNINEYGTKWDVSKSDVYMDNRNLADNVGGHIMMSMDTAWSPPLEWCRKLSKKYKVDVYITYSEQGCDFYGEATYSNGDEGESYSAPYLEGIYHSGNDSFWSEVQLILENNESDLDELLSTTFSFLTNEDRKVFVEMYEDNLNSN